MILYFEPREVIKMCNIAARSIGCRSASPEDGPVILLGLGREGVIMHPKMAKSKMREKATVYPMRSVALEKVWRASRRGADKRKWTWQVQASLLKRVAGFALDLPKDSGCVRIQDDGYDLIVEVATREEARLLAL